MQSDEPRIAASKFSSCVREFQIAVTMHLSLYTIPGLDSLDTHLLHHAGDQMQRFCVPEIGMRAFGPAALSEQARRIDVGNVLLNEGDSHRSPTTDAAEAY